MVSAPPGTTVEPLYLRLVFDSTVDERSRWSPHAAEATTPSNLPIAMAWHTLVVLECMNDVAAVIESWPQAANPEMARRRPETFGFPRGRDLVRLWQALKAAQDITNAQLYEDVFAGGLGDRETMLTVAKALAGDSWSRSVAERFLRRGSLPLVAASKQSPLQFVVELVPYATAAAGVAGSWLGILKMIEHTYLIKPRVAAKRAQLEREAEQEITEIERLKQQRLMYQDAGRRIQDTYTLQTLLSGELSESPQLDDSVQ